MEWKNARAISNIYYIFGAEAIVESLIKVHSLSLLMTLECTTLAFLIKLMHLVQDKHSMRLCYVSLWFIWLPQRKHQLDFFEWAIICVWMKFICTIWTIENNYYMGSCHDNTSITRLLVPFLFKEIGRNSLDQAFVHLHISREWIVKDTKPK